MYISHNVHNSCVLDERLTGYVLRLKLKVNPLVVNNVCTEIDVYGFFYT